MKILCKYYPNTVRLVSGIETFSQMSGFRFFCLDGVVVKSKTQFKVSTDNVIVFVSAISSKTKKNLMVLMTNSPRFRDKDGVPIDIDFNDYIGIDFTLCQLLLEKYSVTNNHFDIEFAENGNVINISPARDASKKPYLVCCVKSPIGEIITTGDAAIKSALCSHLNLKSFSYTAKSADLEKSIAVKNSRGEIFKEIAHYLNRTIVLVSSLDDSRIVEQYISSSAILEIYTKQDGSRFYKNVSSSALKTVVPFCIYLTYASVNDIIREQGRSLSKSS